MVKLVGNLIIEVTRRCNMICGHCLRGKAQNKKMTREYMISTITQFDYISNITFSGGEPSLNPAAIEDFIHICQMNDVSVGNFFIATNGKRCTQRFIDAVNHLYNFCDDNEVSKISISNDEFHEDATEIALNRLFNLEFASNRNEDGKLEFWYGEKTNMINQGLFSENYGYGRENTPESFEYVDKEELKDGNINELTLYLNCDGKIILGCDWSYKNQKKHVLCNSDESIINKLLERC